MDPRRNGSLYAYTQLQGEGASVLPIPWLRLCMCQEFVRIFNTTCSASDRLSSDCCSVPNCRFKKWWFWTCFLWPLTCRGLQYHCSLCFIVARYIYTVYSMYTYANILYVEKKATLGIPPPLAQFQRDAAAASVAVLRTISHWLALAPGPGPSHRGARRRNNPFERSCSPN